MNVRAKVARDLAEADTVQAYIDLLARTLTRYGDTDATREGAAQFELICTHTEEEVPEEWRIHYRYPHYSAAFDAIRRHGWLTGHGPGLHRDGDFTEAASLVCDVLCALRLLGFQDSQINHIIDQVENRFLGKEADSDVATAPSTHWPSQAEGASAPPHSHPTQGQ